MKKEAGPSLQELEPAALESGRRKRILATVSQELIVEFGQAFILRSPYHAIQFCQRFTDQEIVSALPAQLSSRDDLLKGTVGR